MNGRYYRASHVFQSKQDMSDNIMSRGEVVGLIVRLAALTTVSYYTMKLLMEAIDPTRKQKMAAQKRAEKLLARFAMIIKG